MRINLKNKSESNGAVLDKDSISMLIKQVVMNGVWSDATVLPDVSWIMPLVVEELFLVMSEHTSNKTKAAKMLGVHRGRYCSKVDALLLNKQNDIPSC